MRTVFYEPAGLFPSVSAGSCSCSEQGSLQTHQWRVADKIVNEGYGMKTSV